RIRGRVHAECPIRRYSEDSPPLLPRSAELNDPGHVCHRHYGRVAQQHVQKARSSYSSAHIVVSRVGIMRSSEKPFRVASIDVASSVRGRNMFGHFTGKPFYPNRKRERG